MGGASGVASCFAGEGVSRTNTGELKRQIWSKMVYTMSTKMTNCEKTLSRKGYFGRRLVHRRTIAPYAIHGIKYPSEDAWHIIVSEHSKDPCDYWVSRGSCFPMSLLYMRNNRIIIQRTNQPVVDMNPEEREAVMTAIAEWEGPDGPNIGGHEATLSTSCELSGSPAASILKDNAWYR
jgi:hypothetical protein